MPFFANQQRDQLRQMYFDTWRKQGEQLPMTPLEAQIASVVALHPEYHKLFADADSTLDRDWLPEGGNTNPFLHMGLHLAVRDQIATNRPAGIQDVFNALIAGHLSAHEAEHRLIDCLAEALWTAQRNRQPPDEQGYLRKLRALIR